METYAENPSEIYSNSAIDPAMKNAFMQTRKYIMRKYFLTEAEATTIITQAVDFSTTQLVDGNWGVHAVVPKKVFEPYEESEEPEVSLPIVQRSIPPEADLPLNSDNVHWGYFSKELDPVMTVKSGDEVVVEMATHHACDDWDKMIAGDEGTMNIYQKMLFFVLFEIVLTNLSFLNFCCEQEWRIFSTGPLKSKMSSIEVPLVVEMVCMF